MALNKKYLKAHGINHHLSNNDLRSGKNYMKATFSLKLALSALTITMLAGCSAPNITEPNITESVIVTPETYIRAETDRAFTGSIMRSGGVNVFQYDRTPPPVDQQPIVRMNKDTLYSGAIVDTEGGATLTVPEIAGGRYISVLLIDNDHYVPSVIYGAGIHKLPQDTKYLGVLVRLQLFDANDPAEIALVNKLQDQIVQVFEHQIEGTGRIADLGRNARADAGRHEVTYSLLPHAGGFSVESVVRPAYELNTPPIAALCRGSSQRSRACPPFFPVHRP